MARVLLNGLASTAGGGITYLRNVLPRLGRIGSKHRFIALVPEDHIDYYRRMTGNGIELDTAPVAGLLGRLWWEQSALRRYIKRHRVDVFVSLGNFALFGSPAPQILFNRNDLHFSREFDRDLRARGLYGQWVANRLKRVLALRSMRAAAANIAPTAAFAAKLSAASRLPLNAFRVMPFGFDEEVFASDPAPLDGAQLARLDLKRPLRRLLYVSHYNYFRNFETLLRALPRIYDRLRAATGEEVQLVLTTEIRRGAVYGGYDATRAAELIDSLGVGDRIAMLGPVDYNRLHHLYKHCDLFVCPSYSESFGHPLLEAMAAGLPVAAADLPVHREVCADAALYFDVFDERALADRCVEILTDEKLNARLRGEGRGRVRMFSWDKHVEALLGLVEEVSGEGRREITK
ncbi:MAG: glycosyltransferase family 4 protein [Blastocatellales bacterium]|nr:glycosyltransferase family 4 protein [Blastocatellales bacterium]